MGDVPDRPFSGMREQALVDAALAQVRALRQALPAIPGYVLDRVLRRGGQGTVFHGVQLATGQEVAVKILHATAFDARARQRFEREVAVLARLRHKSLVAMHDCGEHEGRPFYVMEYVAGRDLDEDLAAGPRTLREQVELLARVCEAVGAAHVRGVLHRDLKPSNVRIDEDGEPRLLDFGLARALDGDERQVTGAGEFLGSLPWASPEQVSGAPLDARSDVYALGVVLYQALTGAPPYALGGSLAADVAAIRDAVPQPPRRLRAEIDADLAAVLLRALAKDPEHRYQSAVELARDLRRWLAGEAIDARRDRLVHLLGKKIRRHRVASALGAAVLVVLAAAAVAVVDSRAGWRVAAQRLETRLVAERLRDAGAALARGDELAARELLDDVGPRADPWVVGCLRQPLAGRQWRFAPTGERPLAVAVSPDAAVVAVGTFEGTLALLDAGSGAPLWTDDRHLSEVRALAFAPAGDEVFAASGNEVVVFATTSGRRLRSLVSLAGPLERLSVSDAHVLAATPTGEAVLFERPRGIVSLLPARPGATLAAVHAGRRVVATYGRGRLRVDDLSRAASFEVTDVDAGELPPSALTLSADGAHAALGYPASAAAPGALLVFDARTGRRVAAVENLAESPRALVLLDRSCWIGMREGSARHVDLATGRTLEALPGRGAAVRALAAVPLRAGLVVVGDGADLWRVERATLPAAGRGLALAVDASGAPVVLAEDAAGALHLWRDGSPVRVPGAPGGVRAVALDPAAGVVLACATDGSVSRLPLDGGRPERTDLGLSLVAVALDAGEAWLLTAEGLVLARARGGDAFEQRAVTDPGPTAFTAASGRLAVAHGRRVGVFEHGRQAASIDLPPNERVTALAFVATGELLAAGTEAGEVWLLDLAHGERICTLPGPRAGVAALAFAPERAALFVLDRDGRVRGHRPPH